jgi:NTP pyrophosphatase (non-canonical NTP hydrolase)
LERSQVIHLDDLCARMAQAETLYGQFASTHEAMGVAYEEWVEFTDAIRANNLDAVRYEALDLAAVLIRLAEGLETDPELRARSRK